MDIVGRCEIDGKSQIVLAAIILGGLVALAEFAPEARARGLAIEFGWDTPSIPWLCENAAVTECTIAFDGIILDLAQRQGQGSLSWIAWSGDLIPSDVVQNAAEDISLLNDVDFMRLRENSFFRLNSSGWSEPPDWFDGDFDSVVSNISFMADAVYQTDLAGIAFDPEDYFSSCWHYPSRKYSGAKTFAQYQAQVRQRGREVAAAIESACPGRDFVMLFTFANSLPFLSTNWWGHPLSEDTYGLLPAFIDGLLDEACGQIRVIDGLESCYPHMTLAQFQGSVSNYQDGATLSADPLRYLSCVGIGFGTWMDYRSDTFGWYTDPNEFHLNHFTPESFNQAMGFSTDLSEYSWVYTQIPDWYLGAVPEAYSAALSDVTGLPPAAPCNDLWAHLAKAKQPLPIDSAENVHPDVVLSWQAGNKAASHDVYLGTDANAVADANTSQTLGVYVGRQDACEHDPAIFLQLGQRYYWRIDEVNDVNIWQGDVWRFTVVDDDGKAGDPNPPDRARNVPRDMILNWSPGLVAGSHEVYFGTDFGAVSDANTSSPEYKGSQPLAHADYDPPGLLELARTYYWRIDQVNPGYEDSKGDVWGFTVSPCVALDDMERYCTGGGCENRIYDTWIDGYENLTGSLINLGIAPDPVHGPNQSMRFDYDNNSIWVPSDYSETERTFADLCDWAALGAKVLTLYFYGDPNNDADATEQMYVGLQDSSGPDSYAQVTYPDMSNIRVAEWHEWNIALGDFGRVDLNDVNSIYIGFGDRFDPIAGGTGVVWFDDIEICAYRCILPSPYADLSGDCIVDHKDLRMLAEQWLATGSVSADLYPDGKVDCKDFAVLVQEWLEDRLWP